MVDYRQVQERLGRIFERDIFFIVGLTRSGANWLQQALDAHSEVCCKGEGHFTDVLYPLLGRVFEQYNRTSRQVKARLGTAGLGGDAPAYTQGDLDFALATMIGLSLDRWVGDAQVRCIGEKTPEHAMALDLLDRAVPGAMFIHAIRDGRDEAVAAWDFSMRANRDAFSNRYPSFSVFAEVFAKNWVGSVGKARAFGRANRERYIEVRCEDLYTDPVPVVRDLCRFLGLHDADEEVSRCIARAALAVPADGEIGHWRDRFDDEALRLFRRNAGELLKLLEYEE